MLFLGQFSYGPGTVSGPVLEDSPVSEELLINIMPTKSRVALVENGVLQELCLDRVSHYGCLGNIYKGTVSRVLPGLQAAFIDVGLERTALNCWLSLRRAWWIMFSMNSRPSLQNSKNSSADPSVSSVKSSTPGNSLMWCCYDCPVHSTGTLQE